MRPAAEVMLELATSGLDAKQLALVMELSAAVASEGKADPVAEKRRKYDRERKRNRRGDSTGNPPDSADPPPPNDNSNPPTATTSDEVVKPQRKSSPMRSLPEGWEPVLTPAAQRVVDSWPPGMFERTLSGFLNHAADKGRKSKDWQAAFRTWIDNADKWKPKNDQHPRDSRPSTRDIGMRLAASLSGGDGVANDRLPRLGSSSGNG